MVSFQPYPSLSFFDCTSFTSLYPSFCHPNLTFLSKLRLKLLNLHLFYICKQNPSHFSTVLIANNWHSKVYTYNSCVSLKSVDISNDLFYVQDEMLISKQGLLISCWSNLANIHIPNGVVCIGKSVFKNNHQLYSVHISNSVEHIEEYAFARCQNLQSIQIPNNVINIGAYAFSGCRLLQYVQISTNITYIENGIFERCTSLESIRIPNKVTHIGDYAFRGCVALKEVHLSDNVTFIGKGAFKDCVSLQSIYIQKGAKEKIINLLGRQSLSFYEKLIIEK